MLVWNDDTIAYKLPPRFSSIYSGMGSKLEASNGSNLSSRPVSVSSTSSPPTPSSQTTRPDLPHSHSHPHGSISNHHINNAADATLTAQLRQRASAPASILNSRPQSETLHHSTVSEALHFFDTANQVMQSFSGGGGTGSGGSGLFNGASSLGQNPLTGFFPLGQTMGMSMGVDPSSALSTVGLDPGSIVVQGVAQGTGCSMQ